MVYLTSAHLRLHTHSISSTFTAAIWRNSIIKVLIFTSKWHISPYLSYCKIILLNISWLWMVYLTSTHLRLHTHSISSTFTAAIWRNSTIKVLIFTSKWHISPYLSYCKIILLNISWLWMVYLTSTHLRLHTHSISSIFTVPIWRNLRTNVHICTSKWHISPYLSYCKIILLNISWLWMVYLTSTHLRLHTHSISSTFTAAIWRNSTIKVLIFTSKWHISPYLSYCKIILLNISWLWMVYLTSTHLRLHTHSISSIFTVAIWRNLRTNVHICTSKWHISPYLNYCKIILLNISWLWMVYLTSTHLTLHIYSISSTFTAAIWRNSTIKVHMCTSKWHI
ncbi:uncharacterized protein LOC127361972 [Dicentrarchus labrax]|uniref:uncharacterized protein LOC127361972 n=1 Tax=Dicentrarchus labrax TaxID=13489 RepID=UPI0021F50603|nr:uncharacterized protein LOC127361972 [Dicentrarchus labrax]